jgi:hypothetical protein
MNPIKEMFKEACAENNIPFVEVATSPKTAVIKETNVIEGNPVSAWYIRHEGRVYGQYHSEAVAIQTAMERITRTHLRDGKPLDQESIRGQMVFENDTAYRPSFDIHGSHPAPTPYWIFELSTTGYRVPVKMKTLELARAYVAAYGSLNEFKP